VLCFGCRFWELSYHCVRKGVLRGLPLDVALALPRHMQSKLIYTTAEIKTIASNPYLTRVQLSRIVNRTLVELRGLLGW
jgi:hypothetical protein